MQELGQPLLAFPQGGFGPPVARDVGDQHEGAGRLAVGAEVRQQVDVDPAGAAVGVGQLALVAGGAPLAQDRVDLRPDQRGGGFADDLGEREADDRLLVAAEHRCVAEVGETAGEARPLEVRDRHRHVVGEQAKLVELGTQRDDFFGGVVNVQDGTRGSRSATVAARQRSSQARALSDRVRSR